MNCAPPCEWTWSRRLKLEEDKRAGLDEVEIDGTWDFKWRRDSTIRVAFQTPPPGDDATEVHEQLVAEIVDIAGRWRTSIRSEFELTKPIREPLVPLTLHFLRRPLPALPPDREAWPKVRLNEALPYDVLIPLARLPLKIPASPKRPEQDVFLPRAELGRYARRLEYGTPTAFLGAFRLAQSLKALAGTEEWQHTVLHEFGHILGLAHPFQQHDAVVDWKPDPQLKTALRKVLDLKLTDDQLRNYVERQFMARLPAPAAGGPSFSDVWDKPATVRSVMNPPFFHEIANGTTSRDGYIVDPTYADHQHLQSMYPGRN